MIFVFSFFPSDLLAHARFLNSERRESTVKLSVFRRAIRAGPESRKPHSTPPFQGGYSSPRRTWKVPTDYDISDRLQPHPYPHSIPLTTSQSPFSWSRKLRTILYLGLTLWRQSSVSFVKMINFLRTIYGISRHSSAQLHEYREIKNRAWHFPKVR